MKEYCLVIGATNLDLCGKADSLLIKGDSTLGSIKETVGGVGHNIAVNLALLGLPTTFLTTLGSDSFSLIIQKELAKYPELELIVNKVEHSSGLYLYIENQKGEMINAINQMEINNYLTPDVLAEHEELIKKAKLVIIDTNIPQESIGYILSLNPNNLIDPVSCAKSQKLLPFLNKIKILKPNLIELETLTKRTIKTEADLINACKALIELGIETIITTRGKQGSLYFDKTTTLFVENPKVENIINTTGAGDAFCSGVSYSLMHNLAPLDIIKVAM
ncbi:MAG: hypothetical protein GX903_05465, partial [Spirochaetales bacterium]|nr:hypothetical protein [Spirochaetales bacterium]